MVLMQGDKSTMCAKLLLKDWLSTACSIMKCTSLLAYLQWKAFSKLSACLNLLLIIRIRYYCWPLTLQICSEFWHHHHHWFRRWRKICGHPTSTEFN